MARNKQMMTYREENAPTVVVDSNKVTHEAIQARAYQIYLARGNHAGTPSDDWFQAERELVANKHSVDE